MQMLVQFFVILTALLQRSAGRSASVHNPALTFDTEWAAQFGFDHAEISHITPLTFSHSFHCLSVAVHIKFKVLAYKAILPQLNWTQYPSKYKEGINQDSWINFPRMLKQLDWLCSNKD